LKDTRANLSDSEQFLVSLSQSCDDKAKEWDERQKVRAEELTAIAEAITMLNDDDALDLFNKTLPKPGQPAGFALVQTESRNPVVYRARAIIQSALQTSHSASSLDMIAGLLSGKKVNFTKVLVMIDNMVKHLDQEQKDDDKHQEFCRTEFDSAEDNAKDAKEKIASLDTAQEEAETAIAQLADELETTNDEIKTIDKAVADATAQRQDENKEYVSTTSELNEAKDLLEKVKNRLNKFYNPALYKADTTQAPTEAERIAQNVEASFVQIQAHQPAPAPETWSGDYKNKGQKTGGVIALMDMLLKTLVEEVQQGGHDEETAQRDYEKMMESSAKQRKAAVRAVADKSEAKADLETRLVDAKNEHASTSEALAEVQAYITQLHTSCDFLMQNFDFRKGARATERQALLNAKAALQGAKLELAQTGNFLARK
jgi:chromosome segregation ATPase